MGLVERSNQLNIHQYEKTSDVPSASPDVYTSGDAVAALTRYGQNRYGHFGAFMSPEGKAYTDLITASQSPWSLANRLAGLSLDDLWNDSRFHELIKIIPTTEIYTTGGDHDSLGRGKFDVEVTEEGLLVKLPQDATHLTISDPTLLAGICNPESGKTIRFEGEKIERITVGMDEETRDRYRRNGLQGYDYRRNARHLALAYSETGKRLFYDIYGAAKLGVLGKETSVSARLPQPRTDRKPDLVVDELGLAMEVRTPSKVRIDHMGISTNRVDILPQGGQLTDSSEDRYEVHIGTVDGNKEHCPGIFDYTQHGAHVEIDKAVIHDADEASRLLHSSRNCRVHNLQITDFKVQWVKNLMKKYPDTAFRKYAEMALWRRDGKHTPIGHSNYGLGPHTLIVDQVTDPSGVQVMGKSIVRQIATDDSSVFHIGEGRAAMVTTKPDGKLSDFQVAGFSYDRANHEYLLADIPLGWDSIRELLCIIPGFTRDEWEQIESVFR